MSSFYEKVAMMAAVAGSMEIDKGGDMSLVFEKVVSDDISDIVVSVARIGVK